MFSHIVGNKNGVPDTGDILTTEDIENYWTKEAKKDEFEELVSSRAASRFHKFKNPRYVGVSHEERQSGHTFCFTVWDLTHVSCVRRVFLPSQAIQVCTVINDQHLLYCENRRLKLMNIQAIPFKVVQTFQGKTCANHKPTVVFNDFRNGKHFNKTCSITFKSVHRNIHPT